MANGELKIEKGIPIPPRRKSGMTEVLRALEVGDSVLLMTTYSSVGGIVYLARAGTEKKFVTRTEGDGIRVWRTE